jgi:cellulose synthase/poly-beta-1,6-N-acetylglucosamine synthase-like glycosyltransferase
MLYYFVIAFFGLWHRKQKIIFAPQKTFCVIVAAHNEAQVIEPLVQNLKMLDYPKNLYDIYVVADNCDDNTAEIAKKAGANVCVRQTVGERGKGYAMEWMFRKIFTFERKYDAVAIFDADNLVDKNFLKEMNNQLCKGNRVIQGYLGAKNPYDSWVAGTFAIAFWFINYTYHLAKTNIGLSSVLGGTGMVISTDILKEYGWGATCLTEDMEFTMKLLVNGIKTTWAHQAIIYDEKPLTFMQSWHQRKRWAQGQFDVGERYIPHLLKEGFKKRDIKILDGCMHLIQPYFLLLSTVFVIISYIQLMFPPFYTNIYSLMPSEIMTIIMVGQYALPIIVLLKVGVKPKAWFYLILYPLFIYSWIPITFLGFLDRHEHEWSHTKHTRALSYDEVVKK